MELGGDSREFLELESSGEGEYDQNILYMYMKFLMNKSV